jgi:hypothetical protein
MNAFAVYDPKLKQVAVSDYGQLMIFTGKNVAQLDAQGHEVIVEVTIRPIPKPAPIRRRRAS